MQQDARALFTVKSMPDYKVNDIPLWENDIPYFDSTIDQEIPSITPFLLDKSDGPRPAVCVFPGGAYICRCVDYEGWDIGNWLNSIGINAFVVNYRYAPYRHPVPYTDGRRAISYVRKNAEAFGVDPNKIGILGFSAGGHLIGDLSVHYDKKIDVRDDIDEVSARPDFSIFCYPVISSADFGHQFSLQMLLGDDYGKPEMMEYYSIEKQVDSKTPPAFIWTTATDEMSYLNSLVYAQACWKNGIEADLHIFSMGRHGLGLADGKGEDNDVPTVHGWTNNCELWLKHLLN